MGKNILSSKETYLLHVFDHMFNLPVADSPHLGTIKIFEPFFLQSD